MRAELTRSLHFADLNSRARLAIAREALPAALAALAPGVWVSTMEVAKRVASIIDDDDPGAISSVLLTLAEEMPHCSRKGQPFSRYGKTMYPRQWINLAVPEDDLWTIVPEKA